MINQYHLLIFAIITMASCSQKISTTKTVEKETTTIDTTKTRKIEKTKGDSTGFEFNLSELTTSQSVPENLTTGEIKEQPVLFNDDPVIFHKQVKKGNVTSSIDITKKGNVKVSCKEDSLQHVIDQLTIMINKSKETTTTTDTTKIEHKPTKFDLFCRGFTIAVLIAIGLLIANKFKKFIPWIG